MRQSEENIRKIEDAAISGKYQIVCRQVFGSLNSWYITNNPITEWNWNFNEYRIYVGCNEPPMTNKMNDYSVYYCGYNYYFLEGGAVKKQVNVNVAQDCESAPYFKSNHILSDKITPLENGNVEIENLRADGLKANEIFTDKVTSLKGDTVSIGQNFAVEGKLKVADDATFSKNLTVDGNLTVKGDTKQVNTVLETLNYKRIEVNSTGEVSLSSADTDSILVGTKTSTNLGIDANEIQARNNGSASTLYLNPQGGETNIPNIKVGKFSITEQNLVNLIYPVGSIYMSVNNVSPASFLGGSWEQIKDTFLLTAGNTYKAGSTGGEATHKLTEEEMPKHSHPFSFSHTHNGTTDTSNATHSHDLSNTSHKHGQNTNFPGSKFDNSTNHVQCPHVAASALGVSVSTDKNWPTANGLTVEEKNAYNNNSTWRVFTDNASIGGSVDSADATHSHDFKTGEASPSSGTTNSKGSDNAHNNMPPYLAVYCWKRVS